MRGTPRLPNRMAPARPKPKPDANAVAASPPPAHTETASPATAPKTARTPGSPTMRTLHDLRDEMLAVAQGTRPVPPVQSVTDGESVSGLLGVLTLANRALMHLIATELPETVSRLAQLSSDVQSKMSQIAK